MQGSILDHVGRTPLVPLRRLGQGLSADRLREGRVAATPAGASRTASAWP